MHLRQDKQNYVKVSFLKRAALAAFAIGADPLARISRPRVHGSSGHGRTDGPV